MPEENRLSVAERNTIIAPTSQGPYYGRHMSVVSKHLGLVLLSVAVSSLAMSACSSSKTVEEINSFADRVCACQDAPCAVSVEGDYIAWSKENQRARGSEGDRKDVEEGLQRFSECYEKLVGPQGMAPVKVPKVDLAPKARVPRPTPAPAADSPPAEESAKAEAVQTPKPAENKAPTP